MRWILAAVLCIAIAACGNKGPLYLPDTPGAVDALDDSGSKTKAKPAREEASS